MRSFDLNQPAFTSDDGDPEGFRSAVARPGSTLGAEHSGVSVYELAPGQAICAYHYEMGEEEWAMPLEGAHELRNDGAVPERLLMFSERWELTATVYPDSDKIGIWTGHKPDDGSFVRSTSVDYFHEVPDRSAGVAR